MNIRRIVISVPKSVSLTRKARNPSSALLTKCVRSASNRLQSVAPLRSLLVEAVAPREGTVAAYGSQNPSEWLRPLTLAAPNVHLLGRTPTFVGCIHSGGQAGGLSNICVRAPSGFAVRFAPRNGMRYTVRNPGPETSSEPDFRGDQGIQRLNTSPKRALNDTQIAEEPATALISSPHVNTSNATNGARISLSSTS